MSSNVSPIVPDIESLCDLLQAAIDLLQNNDDSFRAESQAMQLARVKSFRTQKIDPIGTDEICRVALMMALVEDNLTTERWGAELVNHAIKMINFHQELDDLSASLQEQSIARLNHTLADCREMARLNSPID